MSMIMSKIMSKRLRGALPVHEEVLVSFFVGSSVASLHRMNLLQEN